MSDTQTLSDVLALLTKVSGKLGDRVDKIEKIIGNKLKKERSDVAENDTKKNEKEEELSTLTKLLKLQVDKDKKPEQVVEEKQQVIITSFGREAKNSLKELFIKEEKPVVEKKKEDSSGLSEIVKKLTSFLPMLGVALGSLGGLLGSLSEGKLGDLVQKLKEGKFSEAAEVARKLMTDVLEPGFFSIPIIGPIAAFGKAYEEFKKGNLIAGLKNIVQGIIGLSGLPAAFKIFLIGGVEMIGDMLEKEFPDFKIPEGKGGPVMAFSLKSIGLAITKAFTKYGKFGKRIPIIGSIVNFADAYQAFETGTPEGILKGILDVTAGIVNFIPGKGTLLSMGIDMLNALLFTTTEETVNGETRVKISWADWYNKFCLQLQNYFPFKQIAHLEQGFKMIYNGDFKGGIKELGRSIPTVNFLIDLFDSASVIYQENKSKGGGVKDFFTSIKDSILTAIVNNVPEVFGIRTHLAKLFGVELSSLSPTTSTQITLPDGSRPPVQNITQEMLDELDSSYKASQEEQKKKAEAYKKVFEQKRNSQNTQNVNDFIKTSDGKLIIPDKQDSLIGFKKDGPLDTMFNKNLKTSQENNSILKKYAEDSSDLLSKQLNLLTENNRLLNSLTLSLKAPASNISKSTNISNTFNGSNTLRGLQGLPLT